ncbi:MAG TPA: homocysteine S-methyltransferase family protein, partial [Aggregatilineales bacterium]|nr:homocysteine S-methyltransferase family protein [Aggregatilineales bacterium]
MARIPFLERLEQKPLLADGAMGTMLYQSGVGFGECFDELNLTNPAMVATIHRKYVEAGAELIETNTFSANEFKLRQFGLQDKVEAINRAGVELARRVIEASFRENVYIAGSVGPLGVWIEPIGRISEEKAFAAFRRQIVTLIESGVDVIILETFSDIIEIEVALRAARDVSADIPIIAQITFTRDDLTVLGDSPATAPERLAELDADVIGLNCSSGPSQLLRLSAVMKSIAPHKKLSVQPNAGWPEQRIGGRVAYPATPHYLGEYALAFAEAGISIIGGCCGTTEEHIRAMREALDDDKRPHATLITIPKAKDLVLEAPVEQPTRFAQKLAAGEFVTTAEIAPPRSFTAQRVIAAAEMLRDAGLDFLNVSDAPLARMRMSPWAVAYLIQQDVGLEMILHFPV